MKLLVCLAALLTTSTSRAADPPPQQPLPPETTTISPAPLRPVPSIQPVAFWAVPSNNTRYIGYYVGGGSAPLIRAAPRRSYEGTWGWDFQGWLIPRRINLGWWHGRRYQGGTGAYKTDGPRYHEP